MKRIIPVGIAALGVVGLLGLGASAASAAPRVTIQGSACATISADQASLSVSLAAANTTLSNDQGNFANATEALSGPNGASFTFAQDFNIYVVAVTNSNPTDGPLANLKDSQTALGTDLTAWASAESAVNTAQNVVNADNVSSNLLSDLSEALSC
ncbi:MAG TPA: hypothetical protein VHT30_02735 [Acidimicrobiales bacterium]|jgi:hypothetical protein|nr:hypothetical protein [Acidimicrobiales bacterium]